MRKKLDFAIIVFIALLGFAIFANFGYQPSVVGFGVMDVTGMAGLSDITGKVWYNPWTWFADDEVPAYFEEMEDDFTNRGSDYVGENYDANLILDYLDYKKQDSSVSNTEIDYILDAATHSYDLVQPSSSLRYCDPDCPPPSDILDAGLESTNVDQARDLATWYYDELQNDPTSSQYESEELEDLLTEFEDMWAGRQLDNIRQAAFVDYSLEELRLIEKYKSDELNPEELNLLAEGIIEAREFEEESPIGDFPEFEGEEGYSTVGPFISVAVSRGSESSTTIGNLQAANDDIVTEDEGVTDLSQWGDAPNLGSRRDPYTAEEIPDDALRNRLNKLLSDRQKAQAEEARIDEGLYGDKEEKKEEPAPRRRTFQDTLGAIYQGASKGRYLAEMFGIEAFDWAEEFFNEEFGRIITGEPPAGICDAPLRNSENGQGMIISSSALNAIVAHIEGEKSVVVDPNGNTEYFYRITLQINGKDGEAINYNIQLLKNGALQRTVFPQDQSSGNKVDLTGTNAIIKYSVNDYDTLCLTSSVGNTCNRFADVTQFARITPSAGLPTPGGSNGGGASAPANAGSGW